MNKNKPLITKGKILCAYGKINKKDGISETYYLIDKNPATEYPCVLYVKKQQEEKNSNHKHGPLYEKTYIGNMPCWIDKNGYIIPAEEKTRGNN